MAAEALPLPLQQADFSIVEEIHRSSGGTVYLGRHRPTGRSVVLKERRVSELGHGKGIDNEAEMYERVPPHNNLIRYLGHYRRSGRTGRDGSCTPRGGRCQVRTTTGQSGPLARRRRGDPLRHKLLKC